MARRPAKTLKSRAGKRRKAPAPRRRILPALRQRLLTGFGALPRLQLPRLGRRRRISLALQGGGSHGAFTWGVLERLLEEDWLQIDAVSGASAGAMNGAVLISGYLNGGRAGARANLERLWRSVHEMGRLAQVASNPLAHLLGGANGPLSGALNPFTQFSSPYQLNPLDLNPLRDLVNELVDVEAIRRDRRIAFFVSATNVHDGTPRVFPRQEFSGDVLLASACLPTLHRAIEIDGLHYWDGGFTSNPPLLPLVQHGRPRDLLVVHIDTQVGRDVPVTNNAIARRLQNILTNAPLVHEIRLLNELQSGRSIRGPLGRRLRRVTLHHILPPDDLTQRENSSKLKTDWHFLSMLRDQGRQAASEWLTRARSELGGGRSRGPDNHLLRASGSGVAPALS